MEVDTQKELLKSIQNLQEAITAKFSSAQPAAVEAEKDQLVKEVRELQEKMKLIQQAKAISKMVFAVPGAKAEAGDKLVTFGRFLKGVKRNDSQFLNEVIKAATQMGEDTNADGGYTVPVEFSNEIIPILKQASIARRIARIVPMGSKTRTIPSQLTDPAVTWTGEGVAKTQTKVTFAQITQTAKKLAAIIPVTDELLADNDVALDRFLFETVAQAFGAEEDRVAFVGSTGAGDPFNGVYNATGVNTVTMDGATLAYADLVDLIFAVSAPYRAGARFVLNGTALSVAMKLTDADGRPIWAPSMQDGVPGRVLGFPYEESDQLPTDLGAGTDSTPILFGNFGQYLWISPRGEYSVDSSNSATDGTNHAFIKNETWFRFEERLSIDVVKGSAFSRMLVK